MDALTYAQQLIAFDSTSYRSNAEVAGFVEHALARLGFETERIEYDDAAGVRKVNVIGRKGTGSGGLAYFGHTDVVPASRWFRESPGAFEPTVDGGRLYGRGSTDMKGSVACMLAAAERLASENYAHPLYISCSADEEVVRRGINEVVARSALYQQLVEGRACGIVGEPTRLQVVYAHKGGCCFTVTSRGRAAHSSTREGVNANLAMIPFLMEMKAIHDETEADAKWMNDEFDPPTICFNLGINDHTRAINVTPPQSICTVCFRPMPDTDTETLLARVHRAAQENHLEFRRDVLRRPFRTDPGSEFVRAAVQLTGGLPPRTVGYGTEATDLSALGNLIVLGPGDIAQAHAHDEWIELDQLEKGAAVYGSFIRRFCLDE